MMGSFGDSDELEICYEKVSKIRKNVLKLNVETLAKHKPLNFLINKTQIGKLDDNGNEYKSSEGWLSKTDKPLMDNDGASRPKKPNSRSSSHSPSPKHRSSTPQKPQNTITNYFTPSPIKGQSSGRKSASYLPFTPDKANVLSRILFAEEKGKGLFPASSSNKSAMLAHVHQKRSGHSSEPVSDLPFSSERANVISRILYTEEKVNGLCPASSSNKSAILASVNQKRSINLSTVSEQTSEDEDLEVFMNHSKKRTADSRVGRHGLSSGKRAPMKDRNTSINSNHAKMTVSQKSTGHDKSILITKECSTPPKFSSSSGHEDIKISLAIQKRYGKFIERNGSIKSLIDTTLDLSKKRKRSAINRLSKFSPFKKSNSLKKRKLSICSDSNTSSVHDSKLSFDKQKYGETSVNEEDTATPPSPSLLMENESKFLVDILGEGDPIFINCNELLNESDSKTFCKRLYLNDKTGDVEVVEIEEESSDCEDPLLIMGAEEKFDAPVDPISVTKDKIALPSAVPVEEHQNSAAVCDSYLPTIGAVQKTHSGGNADPYLKLMYHIVLNSYLDYFPFGFLVPILGEEEFNVVAAFHGLPTFSQRLYGRLFTRKHIWIRVLSMKYDTAMLTNGIPPLVESGLVTYICDNEDLSVLLKLMTLKEIKKLCKTFHLNEAGNKANLVKSLLNTAATQKTLGTASGQNSTSIIKSKVLDSLGPIVKLCDEPRKVFLRCLLIDTYAHYRGDEKERLSDLMSRIVRRDKSEIIFPVYHVRPTTVFPSRQHFLDYQEAIDLHAELEEAMQEKRWESACILTREASMRFERLTKQHNYIAEILSMPKYLRQFTDGWCYAWALTKGVEALKKFKRMQEAIDVLELLLSQNLFKPHHRGAWYNELAMVYQVHLRYSLKASAVIVRGLDETETEVTPIWRHCLCHRGEAILRKKTTVLNGEEMEQLSKVCQRASKLCPPFTITIKAKALQRSVSGFKKIYIHEADDGGKEYVSVEEMAVNHYVSNGYAHHLHDEGRTLFTLVLSCFYDIIYDSSTQTTHSVFHSEFQTAPLDWGTPDFFLNRQQQIEARLEAMRAGEFDTVATLITDCQQNHDAEESIVGWKSKLVTQFRLQILLGLVQCIGVTIFTDIAEHLLKNYKIYSSGFPDLTVWSMAHNKYLFVEVKGPKDHLAPNQKVWIHNLLKFGAQAEVCHVSTVGSKAKKEKTLKPDVA